MELNTLNGVMNACMSFPIQNAWKEGKPLAVHGVVYNPADGTLKVQSHSPRESPLLTPPERLLGVVHNSVPSQAWASSAYSSVDWVGCSPLHTFESLHQSFLWMLLSWVGQRGQAGRRCSTKCSCVQELAGPITGPGDMKSFPTA